MDAQISAAIHAAGLDRFVPLLLALHMLASALDALIPQPKPGSHWIPLRKVLSFLAINFWNAGNANQPALLTWVQRIAQLLVSVLPPAPAAAPVAPVAPAAPVVAQPQRVEPVGPTTVIPIPAQPGQVIPPAPQPLPQQFKPMPNPLFPQYPSPGNP